MIQLFARIHHIHLLWFLFALILLKTYESPEMGKDLYLIDVLKDILLTQKQGNIKISERKKNLCLYRECRVACLMCLSVKGSCLALQSDSILFLANPF